MSISGQASAPAAGLPQRWTGNLAPHRLTILLLALLVPTHAAFAHPWIDVFGPSRPLYTLGFGGIVAGVDSTGRVGTLLWPHSGAFNQIAPADPANATPSGCQWGIAGGGKADWLSGAAWKTEKAGPPSPESAILEFVSSCAALKATATQTLLVSPKNGLMAARIQIDASEPLGAISWFQQFAPVPFDRLPLALPVALPQASCGFASFFDSQRARLYQFRPAHPGRQDWDHARSLQESHATPAEWSSFQDGAWCATAFSTREITCQFGDGEKRPHAESAALGQVGVTVTVLPASGRSPNRAEVFIAFGRNRTEADKALDTALKQGFDALQSETQAEYAALLSPASPRLSDNADKQDRALRDLRVLFAALDSKSGTVVAAPAAQPPLCATWPELSAWTALAWHLSGFTDQAARQLQFFYAPLLAKDSRTGTTPALPELLRTDTASALPSFVHNPASTAWIVLAVVQLARLSPPDSVPANALSNYNELVLPAMQYLRRWSTPSTGGPPPGFDPLPFRDVSSVSNELLYYLGVQGSFDMATITKQPPHPDWQSWQRELEALLRFRMVNEPDGWDLSPTLSAWAAMTLSPADPLRKAAVRTPSGLVALGDCPIPTLPPATTTILATPDTFDSALDLVALFHPTPHKP